ncbi:hypothetical protein [Actinoplanes sp. DH11]|uniref:hypothetical protein n=1 Tax=Actinoplanes sp. DH11 TaxID=2857011 RepID=UPI001E5F3D9B|nr:hypothetical protein [Actinoplanes sp. DH11]
MEQDTSASEPLVDALARVGITVTDEGRSRARRLLDEARARRDPAKFEALRERLGFNASRPA